MDKPYTMRVHFGKMPDGYATHYHVSMYSTKIGENVTKEHTKFNTASEAIALVERAKLDYPDHEFWDANFAQEWKKGQRHDGD